MIHCAITPIDPSVSKTLDKAIAKGVKIVLMDNDIPGWAGRSALATTNNLEAGKIAGAHLKTLLKEGDKIGILDGKPDVAPLNDRVEGMLQGLGGLKVYIVGHTDDSGVLTHNIALSQQRADAVVKVLASRYGVAADRMAAKGLASYSPVASNHDEAGKAKNRRVELVEQ